MHPKIKTNNRLTFKHVILNYNMLLNIYLPKKVKNDHRSKSFQFKQLERRSLKNQGFNRVQTHDLRDTGVMLYHYWDYEAIHWEWGQFIEFMSPMRRDKSVP